MCILLTFTFTQKVVEAAMLGNICNSIGLDTPNIPTSTITFICSDVDGFTLQVSQPTIIPLCSMSTHRPVAGHDVAALGNSYRDFHLSFQLYRSILRSILCCCTIISDIPRHIRFLDFISLSDKAETTIGCSLWSLLKSKQTACICNQSRAEAKMLVLVYF